MKTKKFTVLILLVVTTLFLSACDLSLFKKKYEVQGKVTDVEGNGIEGVTLNFSGEVNGVAKTDATGHWNMADLKGLVTVTASKEGWTFAPKKLDVTDARSDVNFIGTSLTPESAVTGLIKDFCWAMLNEDVQVLSDLFDDSYFTNKGITREMYIESTITLFEKVDYTSLEFEIDLANSTFISTEAFIRVKFEISMIESGEPSSLVAYHTIDAINMDSGWKFINMGGYSPEEAEIQVLVDQFLVGFIKEDLDAIGAMVSSELQESSLLSNLETLFADIDIESYNLIDKIILNYNGINKVAMRVGLAITDSEAMSDQDICHLYMDYVLENDQWLINFVSMGGKTINIHS